MFNSTNFIVTCFVKKLECDSFCIYISRCEIKTEVFCRAPLKMIWVHCEIICHRSINLAWAGFMCRWHGLHVSLMSSLCTFLLSLKSQPSISSLSYIQHKRQHQSIDSNRQSAFTMGEGEPDRICEVNVLTMHENTSTDWDGRIHIGIKNRAFTSSVHSVQWVLFRYDDFYPSNTQHTNSQRLNFIGPIRFHHCYKNCVCRSTKSSLLSLRRLTTLIFNSYQSPWVLSTAGIRIMQHSGEDAVDEHAQFLWQWWHRMGPMKSSLWELVCWVLDGWESSYRNSTHCTEWTLDVHARFLIPMCIRTSYSVLAFSCIVRTFTSHILSGSPSPIVNALCLILQTANAQMECTRHTNDIKCYAATMETHKHQSNCRMDISTKTTQRLRVHTIRLEILKECKLKIRVQNISDTCGSCQRHMAGLWDQIYLPMLPHVQQRSVSSAS